MTGTATSIGDGYDLERDRLETLRALLADNLVAVDEAITTEDHKT